MISKSPFAPSKDGGKADILCLTRKPQAVTHDIQGSKLYA